MDLDLPIELWEQGLACKNWLLPKQVGLAAGAYWGLSPPLCGKKLDLASWSLTRHRELRPISNHASLQ
jgi:hypothetical protein